MDEFEACITTPINERGFNPNAQIPYGLKVEHIQAAMQDFQIFLNIVNTELYQANIQRFESVFPPGHFSSTVSEFMNVAIPKHCSTLVKNKYPQGHPDLVPTGTYPNDAVQHANPSKGIEIKASRYKKRWQGHNPEECWLMVFVLDSNLSNLIEPPRPFRFEAVYGAQLFKADWKYYGVSENSRRCPTANVLKSGHDKMVENWIYKYEIQSQLDLI